MRTRPTRTFNILDGEEFHPAQEFKAYEVVFGMAIYLAIFTGVMLIATFIYTAAH